MISATFGDSSNNVIGRAPPNRGANRRASCCPTAFCIWRAGMSWWQGVLVVLLGNLITLVPMVLSGHPGTKYGVPFPVLARASFGVRGASLAAMLRCYCEALPLLRLRQDSPRLLVRQRPCPSVVTMET